VVTCSAYQLAEPSGAWMLVLLSNLA